MTAASFGFQTGSLLGGTVLRSVFPALARAPQGLRFLSSVCGLGAEVASFEVTQRSLGYLEQGAASPSSLWAWQGEGGWKQSLWAGLINFGTLKTGNALFACQNFLVRELVSDSAMVAGHHLSHALGWEVAPKGSLSEQFAQAAIANVGISAGMALFQRASGHRAHSIQSSLHRRSQLRAFETRPYTLSASQNPVRFSTNPNDPGFRRAFSPTESFEDFLKRQGWPQEGVAYLTTQIDALLKRKIEGSDVKRGLFKQRLIPELKRAVEAMADWRVARQLRVLGYFYGTCVLAENKPLPNLSGILVKLRNTFPIYKDPGRLFQDLDLLLPRVPPEALGQAAELLGILCRNPESGAKEFIEIIDSLPTRVDFENGISTLRQYVQHLELMGVSTENKLRHLRLIRDLLRANPHSGHYLLEALYHGLERDCIPLELADEALNIQSFVRRSGFFSLVLFRKYQQMGEAFWIWYENQKALIVNNEWDADKMRLAYGQEMDFELALSTFPPHAGTSGNLEALKNFWNECRLNGARARPVRISPGTASYRLRLETSRLSPDLAESVSSFWRQLIFEDYNEGFHDLEARLAIEDYARSPQNREDTLRLGVILFRSFLSDWSGLDYFILRGPIDAVQKRSLLLEGLKSPEFRKDMHHLCENLFNGREAIFEMPQGKRKKIDPKKAGNFVAGLERDWETHRDDPALLSKVIGSKVMAFEAEEIHRHVLPLMGNAPLEEIVQEWSSRRGCIPPKAWMDRFLINLIESLEGSKSDCTLVENEGEFKLRSANGLAYALMPCHMGLCTWDDVSLWTHPYYDPWAFVSETTCVGLVDYLLPASNAEKALVWVGLNVHPELSDRVDARYLFHVMTPFGAWLAQQNRTTHFYVTTRQGIFSNTASLRYFMQEHANDRTILALSYPIKWNQKPEPYLIEEVFSL